MKTRSIVRPQACEACPYRKDVPSGVWSAAEYAKLVDYDKPLAEQPAASFSCHASPELHCHGWAVCHSKADPGPLALLLRGRPEIPKPSTGLFSSGTEAALHGIRDVANPTPESRAMMDKLLGKYKRLRTHKKTKPKTKRTK
jgi:hypothetical protein